MTQLILNTTGSEYVLELVPGETILEGLRRHNLPLHSVFILSDDGDFVSLSEKVQNNRGYNAYSMRNADFSLLQPSFVVKRTVDPIAEVIDYDDETQKKLIVQLNRKEAEEFVFRSVCASLDECRERFDISSFQIALSPGGDGRILAEAVRRYWDLHPTCRFHAVIVAVGFEDEAEHISTALELANRFGFPVTALPSVEGARLLGYVKSLADMADAYRAEFPGDEGEVMLTYWVQELNYRIAEQNGRQAILFGYNQEDILAERLYQLSFGKLLDRLPERSISGVRIVAPLSQVPKRILDAMDYNNSFRNYRLRTPSVSYTRSAFYFLSYMLAEQFPGIAAALAGENRYIVTESGSVHNWLARNSEM